MLEIGERPWGKYYVLADEPNYKLKRIEVNPGQNYLTNIITKDKSSGPSLKGCNCSFR
jgi:mannose-6-phosphate isomerase-like protein (cupin superfamily)